MLGCCRGPYSLAARGEGPHPELFSQVDKVSNLPNNSAILGLFYCAAWGLYFYLSNLAGTWSHAVAFVGTPFESVIFFFDPTELPIITIYALYIPIFINWMKKATDESALRRYVIPTPRHLRLDLHGHRLPHRPQDGQLLVPAHLRGHHAHRQALRQK